MSPFDTGEKGMWLPKPVLKILSALMKKLMQPSTRKIESKLVSAIWELARKGQPDNYSITTCGNALLLDFNNGTRWWVVYQGEDIGSVLGVLEEFNRLAHDDIVILKPVHIDQVDVGRLLVDVESIMTYQEKHPDISATEALRVYDEMTGSASVVSLGRAASNKLKANYDTKVSVSYRGLVEEKVCKVSFSLDTEPERVIVVGVELDGIVLPQELAIAAKVIVDESLGYGNEINFRLNDIPTNVEWVLRKATRSLSPPCIGLKFAFEQNE